VSSLLNCCICDSKKTKGIFISNELICTSCIKENKELSKLVSDLKYIQKKMDTEISKDFSISLRAEADISLKIKEVINSKNKKNDNDILLKQEILEKVEVMSNLDKNIKITKEARKNIVKCLNGLGQSELQECVDSIRNVESYKELEAVTHLKKIKQNLDIPNPKDLFNEISNQIINQEHAVKTISRAISKHFCRIKDKNIKKQNIMILGPTGTGKTEICRVLAKKIHLPFVIVDATSFTATGYRGNTASEVIVSSLLSEAQKKGDPKLAEYGIVFIDEIDKKATRNSQNAADIGTASVQQELLKIIEGGLIKTEITDERGVNKKVELDTTNVLFIVAGAFSGIEKIINKSSINKLGLMNSNVQKEEKNFGEIQTKDLVSYGFIPEFLGRFSSITYTLPLVKNDLVKIMTVPENSLVAQYKRLFNQFKVNLEFSEAFLESIAEQAVLENIGARGLERLFENKMEETFFNIYDYIGTTLRIDSNGNPKVFKKFIINN
jgi:ATP-dependent Clp protease ATP-binding subunit ClpX